MKLILILLLCCLLISLCKAASANKDLKPIHIMKAAKSFRRNANLQDAQRKSKILSRQGRNIQRELNEQHRQKANQYKRSIDRKPPKQR
jgi:hypothetical protein